MTIIYRDDATSRVAYRQHAHNTPARAADRHARLRYLDTALAAERAVRLDASLSPYAPLVRMGVKEARLYVLNASAADRARLAGVRPDPLAMVGHGRPEPGALPGSSARALTCLRLLRSPRPLLVASVSTSVYAPSVAASMQLPASALLALHRSAPPVAAPVACRSSSGLVHARPLLAVRPPFRVSDDQPLTYRAQSPCPLVHGCPPSGRAWVCDRCAREHGCDVARYHCAPDHVDVCDACAASHVGPLPLVGAAPAACASAGPIDAHGRPTIFASEWSRFSDPATSEAPSTMSSREYAYEITSFVRLYHRALSSGALHARIAYRSSSAAGAIVAPLAESAWCQPKYYAGLSAAFNRDAWLTRRSITCSDCGPSALSVYFCTNMACPTSTCMVCHLERLHRDTRDNQPHASNYLLPPARECCEQLCSTASTASTMRVDRSMIVRPFAFVRLRGLAAGEMKYADFDPTGAYRCLQAGCGVYVYEIEHCARPASSVSSGGSRKRPRSRAAPTPASVHQLVRSVGEWLPDADCPHLLLNLNGHISIETGSLLFGDAAYAPQAAADAFILPLVRAFRGTPGRSASGECVCVVSVCSMSAVTWDLIVQSHASDPSSAFSALIFTSPVGLGALPGILASFTQAWANAMRAPSADRLADVVRYALSPSHAEHFAPVLLQPGRAPVHFASTGARGEALASCRAPSVHAVAALSAPVCAVPVPALAPVCVAAVASVVRGTPSLSAQRNASVAYLLAECTPSVRASLRVTGVPLDVLTSSLNALVTRAQASIASLRGCAYPPFTRGPSAEGQSYRQWRLRHFTRHGADPTFTWDPAGAQAARHAAQHAPAHAPAAQHAPAPPLTAMRVHSSALPAIELLPQLSVAPASLPVAACRARCDAVIDLASTP